MTDLLSPLTRDSRRALDNAQNLAKKYRQPAVTAEHLLLGVLQLSGCQAEMTLAELQVNITNLKARLEATLKLQARQDQSEVKVGYSQAGLKLAADAAAIIDAAVLEAAANQAEVDTRCLILGMLRHAANAGAEILQQYGVTLARFREAARLGVAPAVNLPRLKKTSALALPIQVSPLFVALAAVMVTSGYFTYAGIGNPGPLVFLFVLSSWIVSVALHEFGHALTAYLGGDESMVYQGYLTLNPLKYTHPVLSILFPVIFMLMGGIGLPGGAVYVNSMAIRSNRWRSLTSAAGPIASLVCALLLAAPFVLGVNNVISLIEHYQFWAALAFLAFLQLTAVFLNLLPIPGLDGFGILEPFMPRGMVQQVNLIRPFSFFLLYGLLFFDTPLRAEFWQAVWWAMDWVSPAIGPLVSVGFDLFRFWMN